MSFRSKPVGWRHESYRHYLAAKGLRTKYDAVKWKKWGEFQGQEIQGRLVEMSPEEYLKKTGLTVDEVKNDSQYQSIWDREKGTPLSIGEFAEKMKSKDVVVEVEVPYVYGEGILADQEGRHRVYAAYLAGEPIIPVMVDDGREATMPEIAQEFVSRAFPDAREEYAKEWDVRFVTEFPSKWMGPKALKIYHDILRERGIRE